MNLVQDFFHLIKFCNSHSYHTSFVLPLLNDSNYRFIEFEKERNEKSFELKTRKLQWKVSGHNWRFGRKTTEESNSFLILLINIHTLLIPTHSNVHVSELWWEARRADMEPPHRPHKSWDISSHQKGSFGSTETGPAGIKRSGNCNICFNCFFNLKSNCERNKSAAWAPI